MDELQAILGQLEDRELDYVFERSKTTSDADAFKNAAIPKSTFYGWPETRRVQLNEYAQQLKRRAKIRGQVVLEDAAEDAARTVVKLLKSHNPNVALNAAKDVLDRTVGRPTQRQEHSGPDGGAIQAEVVIDDARDGILRKLAGIAAVGGADALSEQSDGE